MKKTIIISLFIMVFCSGLVAQSSIQDTTTSSNKFEKAMQTNLEILDSARSPHTLIMLANNFDRIGKAEKKEWLPFYYAAFCYAVMAGNVTDKSQIDPLTEKARTYLEIAGELEKNNSEISSLYAMQVYTKILVDPVSRWQSLGTEAMEWLAKAKQQDPANPRPYLIEARARLHIPESLGGGPKAAKASLEECLARFKTFSPANKLAPGWGKQSAEKMAKSITMH